MNALTVFRSNRLEFLGQALAQTLADNPPSDPLQPIEIGCASYGMEAWLRQRIAQQAGVCANVEFPFPGKVIRTLIDGACDAPSAADGWSPEALPWTVLEVLPALLDLPEFEPVARHFRLDSRADGSLNSRQIALVQAIASVLDSYLTYRPEWVQDWTRGGSLGTEEHSDLSWQPRLIRAIHDHLQTPHTAQRTLDAIEVLRTGPLDEQADPIRVFGFRSMPPLWVALLDAASHRRPVELFLLAPSDQFWDDVRKGASQFAELNEASDEDLAGQIDEVSNGGHPLLANLGRTLRDQQLVLESVFDQYEAVDVFGAPVDDGEPGHALARLQADLFRARLPQDPASRPATAGARSLEFHGCYGALRQVEALHDTVLGLLNESEDLQERDILILTPDIDTYAPLVTAVFNQGPSFPSRAGWWGETGSPRLRVEVRDLSVRRLNPVADAILRVLEMTSGRVLASQVFDWMGLEPVRNTFSLSDSDLEQMRRWLAKAGIRWGVDAAHREEHDQPFDAQNTWEFGLQRLCLGAAMADDGPLWHPTAGRSIRPVDDVEGSGLGTLSKFVRATRSLFHAFDALRAPRSLQAWTRDLKQWIEVLALPPASAGWMSQRVYAEFDTLAGSAPTETVPIDLGAIRALLMQKFDVASPLTAPDPGAITLGSIASSDVLPHKVVALLGMDEGSFPRASSQAAFDLMTRMPRIGDRSLRDEDRATLLHALLAAREHLLVFYTHRDPQSNQEVPPCVPIAELESVMEWTLSGGQSAASAMRFSHPLQGWSRQRFTEDAPTQLQTFDPRLARAAGASEAEPEPRLPFFAGVGAGAEEEPITWDQLLRFWSDPHKALLTHLRVRANNEVSPLEDREPWSIDGLSQWQIRDQFLQDPQDADALPRIQAEGQLPLGVRGQVFAEQMAQFQQAARGLRQRIQLDQPFVIAVADQELHIPALSRIGNTSVRLSASKDQPKETLKSWLTLLVHCAHDPTVKRIVGCHGQKGDWTQFKHRGLLAPDDPLHHLEHLVRAARSWRSGPLPYETQASRSFASAWGKSKVPIEPDSEEMDQCLAKAHAALSNNASGSWTQLFEPGTPLDDIDAFTELALQVWEPLLERERANQKALAWLEEEA